MSTPDLFPVKESWSPKLKWMNSHGIITYHDKETGLLLDTDEDFFPWGCYKEGETFNAINLHERIGFGKTEEEAIIDFCHKTGIKHYSLT